MLLIVISIIIIVSIVAFTNPNEPEKQVHYEIGLSGIKEQYVVGEELQFSIFLNGYGSPCGDYSAQVKKGEKLIEEWSLETSCIGGEKEKKIDLEYHTSGTTTFKLTLTESGLYTVTGEFWKVEYGKFHTKENFTVIEN